jgi:hypothetical protein
VSVLKQKVSFLKLDIQHFRGNGKKKHTPITGNGKKKHAPIRQRRLTVWGVSINAWFVALKTAVQTRLVELEAGRLSDVPVSEL